MNCRSTWRELSSHIGNYDDDDDDDDDYDDDDDDEDPIEFHPLPPRQLTESFPNTPWSNTMVEHNFSQELKTEMYYRFVFFKT